jgi:prepilin-type processing-associated H-X9-DG protein
MGEAVVAKSIGSGGGMLQYAPPQTKSAHEPGSFVPLHLLAKLIVAVAVVPLGFAVECAWGEQRAENVLEMARIAGHAGAIVLLICGYALYRWRGRHELGGERAVAYSGIVVSLFAVWVGFAGLDVNVAHLERRDSCESRLRELGRRMLKAADAKHPSPATRPTLSRADWRDFYYFRDVIEYVSDPSDPNQQGYYKFKYAFVPNVILPGPRDVVVAHDNTSFHDDAGAHFLFADGHVEWIGGSKAERMIHRLDEGHNPP